MRVKKGKYILACADGKYEQKGSYIVHFPFLIHRNEEFKSSVSWALSHMPTGYKVKSGMTLAHAKELCLGLKKYPVFLTPTIETFKAQLQIMQRKQPVKYTAMMSKINEK
jgi:hypothetical protein